MECDIANEQSVQSAFTWVEKTFGGVDLLVNNGGTYTKALFTDENNSRELKNIIDNEILGNILCSRQAIKSMKTRDVNGHIVNINSIFGHKVNQAVPGNKPMNSLYPPAKHAITAVTECIRQELLYLQTQIKITVSYYGSINILNTIFLESNFFYSQSARDCANKILLLAVQTMNL